MVRIAPDISSRVEFLKPGDVLSLKSDPEQTRICSVASGKVKVKIGGAEFMIGPHGLVKIKAGQAAVVENRLYVDAALHLHGFRNV